MSRKRIVEIFGSSPVLLPVVHPVSWDQALESARTAHDAGVKGIFLINQGLYTEKVLELVVAVREELPALWVGVNLLGSTPAEALALALDGCGGRIDGIWSDNSGVDERAAAQTDAQEFVETRRKLDWRGLYFGGVAFKYQRAVAAEHVGSAARAALPFMDVVCTSGPGTGEAADVAKVVAMREGLGPDGALALASGVTSANVASYLPHVDAFLVGTGLEAEFGVLAPGKVVTLNRIIRAGVSQ